MQTTRSKWSSSTAGFTLVELLVVIGIIAVLISILLPSLARARASAETVACASGLRQVAQANMMYQNDNRGFFVPFGLASGYGDPYSSTAPFNDKTQGRWQHLLEPYAKTYKVMNCPTRTASFPQHEVLNADSGAYKRGQSTSGATCNYAYVRTIGGFAAQNSAKKYAIIRAKVAELTPDSQGRRIGLDEIVVFVDGTYWVTTSEPSMYGNDYAAQHWGRFMHGGYNGRAANQISKGTANASFLDGHVEAITFQQVRTINWASNGSHAWMAVTR